MERLKDISGHDAEKLVPPVESAKQNSIFEEQNDNIAHKVLSKRAQKRLLKRKEWLETRPERRIIEKAKKRAKIERLRQEKGFTQTFSAHRKRLKQKKMSDSSCKITVVIDMGFENLMNQRDLGKCLKQLMHCYSINRRLENQLQFHITSFDGTRLKQEMERHQGYENWDCCFHTESYLEAFSNSVPSGSGDNHSANTDTEKFSEQQIANNTVSKFKCLDNPDPKPAVEDSSKLSTPYEMVYLTSESENLLGETLDPKCIYIIGGLVDHNAHKGLCHRLAVEKGIGHARLPIQEVGVEMKTRQVLTIDHVFRILASVASEGKSWKEALLEILPGRKGAKDINPLSILESENCERDTVVKNVSCMIQDGQVIAVKDLS